MADVKLMVMYPRPQDMEAFDTCTRTRTWRPAMDSSGGAPLFLIAEETTFLFGTISLWDRLKGLASPRIRRRLRYSHAEVQ